jgi:hypothetical protein
MSGSIFCSIVNQQGAEAMNQTVKVRENRLRRMADRQGLSLVKTKRRDTRAIDYGTFKVVDAKTGILDQRLDQRAGLSMDEVEQLLTGRSEKAGRKVRR